MEQEEEREWELGLVCKIRKDLGKKESKRRGGRQLALPRTTCNTEENRARGSPLGTNPAWGEETGARGAIT